MRSPFRSYTVDWGHLIFLAAIAGGILWYLLDARSVSLSIHNLLLVQPIALLALGLCLVVVPQCFTRHGSDEVTLRRAKTVIGAPEQMSTNRRDLMQIGGVAAALGCFVVLLNVIGFDIAIFGFCVAVMFICGERRAIPLIVYPIGIALVIVLGFRALLPFPLYTVLL